MVIVGELSYWDPFCPVVLVVINEDPQESFDFLIYAFSLPVCLGMMSGGGGSFDSQKCTQFFQEYQDKGQALVADDFLWETMMTPDMVEEKSCNTRGVNFGSCGDSVDPFGEMVYNN